MPSAEVIIPFRDGPGRAYCLARTVESLKLPWRLAPCPPGPWVKALAVMPAVEASCAEIVVVHDADVACGGLPAALRAVESGAPWAIPHLNVHRLNADGGEEQRPYRGIEGGGIVVARRPTLLEIPLDPRFAGWGQEDESWGVALNVLAGKPWRGKAPLYHFWHPPQQRLSRTRGSREGWNLRREYFRARSDPDRMRALVQEARDLLAERNDPAEAGPLVSRA